MSPLIFKVSNGQPIKSFSCILLSPSSTFKNPFCSIGSTPIIQNILFIIRSVGSSLISMYYFKSPLPFNVTCSPVRGISRWVCLGGHYSAYHSMYNLNSQTSKYEKIPLLISMLPPATDVTLFNALPKYSYLLKYNKK